MNDVQRHSVRKEVDKLIVLVGGDYSKITSTHIANLMEYFETITESYWPAWAIMRYIEVRMFGWKEVMKLMR